MTPNLQADRTTLGVGGAASPEQIRAAYRRLAAVWHPDCGGDAARFQALTSAFHRLMTATPPRRGLLTELKAAFQKTEAEPIDFDLKDGVFRAHTQPKRRRPVLTTYDANGRQAPPKAGKLSVHA